MLTKTKRCLSSDKNFGRMLLFENGKETRKRERKRKTGRKKDREVGRSENVHSRKMKKLIGLSKRMKGSVIITI